MAKRLQVVEGMRAAMRHRHDVVDLIGDDVLAGKGA